MKYQLLVLALYFLMSVCFGSVASGKEEEGVWFFLPFAIFPFLARASINHLIQLYQFAVIFDENDIKCSQTRSY